MRRFLLAAALCLIIGLLGGLMMLAVGPSAAPARYRFVPPREAAFDFNLKDQDGKTQSIKAARGNVVIVTFLFTTCHDLCPAEANLIAAAAEKAGDGVTIYGISVDPDGDTTERAHAFVKRRGLDPRHFRYLLGTREELKPVWRAYGIAPVNATPEDAIAAAEATDKFLAEAAARGQKLGRRPYEAPGPRLTRGRRRPLPGPRRPQLPRPLPPRAGPGLRALRLRDADRQARPPARRASRSSRSTVDGLAADLEALKREP